MALQDGAEAAQVPQLFTAEIAAPRQYRVEGGRAMTLGEDETVAVRPARIGGIVVHGVEIKAHQDIRARERSPGMAALGEPDHAHDVPADIPGNSFQVFSELIVRLLPQDRTFRSAHGYGRSIPSSPPAVRSSLQVQPFSAGREEILQALDGVVYHALKSHVSFP